MNECMYGWMNDGMIEWMMEWWMNDGMIEWMMEWMNEWVNEWMNEWWNELRIEIIEMVHNSSLFNDVSSY